MLRWLCYICYHFPYYISANSKTVTYAYTAKGTLHITLPSRKRVSMWNKKHHYPNFHGQYVYQIYARFACALICCGYMLYVYYIFIFPRLNSTALIDRFMFGTRVRVTGKCSNCVTSSSVECFCISLQCHGYLLYGSELRNRDVFYSIHSWVSRKPPGTSLFTNMA